MTKRTTDEWQTLLDGTTPAPWTPHPEFPNFLVNDHDKMAVAGFLEHEPEDTANKKLVAAAPEAVAEVVRLRQALEQQLAYIAEELEAEGIETHDDIEGTWPSMQRYGELSEVIYQRDFLTRILEGDTDE